MGSGGTAGSSPPPSEAAPLVAESGSGGVEKSSSSGAARRSEWTQSASMLMAEIMGTGVLGLPAAMANLGWVVGVISSLVFGVLSVYAALLLSRVRNELYSSAESFADLALSTGGKDFAVFTRGTVLVTWATLLPYYLLACSESLGALFPEAPLKMYHWAFIVAGLLILPIQSRSLHELSGLALASTLSIVVAVTIILVSLVQEASNGPPAGATHSLWIPEGTSAMSVFGHLSSFTFAYQGHSVMLEIMREMAAPSDFHKAALLANGIMITVYTSTSVVGYAAFGHSVAGFLPDSLPNGPAKRVVGALLIFHTAVAYLIVAQPLHRNLHAIVFPKTLDQLTPLGRTHWLVISLCQLAFSILLCTAVPFFSQLQDLLGSLTGSPMIFGWPAFFFLRGRALHGIPVGWADWAVCVTFLCVLLPLFTIFGTASSLSQIVQSWFEAEHPFGTGGAAQSLPPPAPA